MILHSLYNHHMGNSSLDDVVAGVVCIMCFYQFDVVYVMV